MGKKQNQDPDILDPEDIVVTIDLEDGGSIDCEILTIFTVDKQDYIALMPIDENEKVIESEGVYLYRYFEENGEYSVGNIESDAEFEKVSKELDRILGN